MLSKVTVKSFGAVGEQGRDPDVGGLDVGAVRVAMDATYPPFESLDSSGQIVGFSKDIADALGWERFSLLGHSMGAAAAAMPAVLVELGFITNPADVDIGVIFGFGFPPFRGGLLREADRHGLRWVVDRLDGFAERYGERLRPAALLREMADRGATFYK